MHHYHDQRHFQLLSTISRGTVLYCNTLCLTVMES